MTGLCLISQIFSTLYQTKEIFPVYETDVSVNLNILSEMDRKNSLGIALKASQQAMPVGDICTKTAK